MITSSTPRATARLQMPATVPRDKRRGDSGVTEAFSSNSAKSGTFLLVVRDRRKVFGSRPGSAIIRATSVERDVTTCLKGG
ncbi:hypothetical protein GCM10022200_08130 [Microbacterium awajiense]|uniref:Uncharacterized protein n=1 Tax=Microbacterium awajiense TaxID=415214 RepID=A0ABP7AAG8_9MICO